MSKEKRLSQSVARKFVITNSLQLKQNKSAEFYSPEVHQQDLTKMKELQRFQNSTFDELTIQKFIEDQKTIMELSGRLQELQNEVNCMNDSKDFQDAESVRSGNSHVTSQPGVFPKHPPFEGLLRPSFISQRHTDGPPNIWDTSGISGNVFALPQASSSAPYPQELNSTWKKTIEEPIHMSTAEKSERPERDQDLRCQPGPSAKDSVIFSGGDYSKNYGADQQRLQISDLHFDKFPSPATFACWKIRFKTEVCTCSQSPTEAMQWIKEVELVDSVDELRSSSSTRGISMPNFEVLDARLASALNKIIHNSHFKRRISLEEERWKSCLAAGGGSQRRYQYCSDYLGSIIYLCALQGHSGHNLIDPTLQDNVIIQRGIFHHIHHIGCAFNLHSIINNGLIPGGQGSSRRQTVFFLPIDPRDKNHEDPEHIDFSVPHRARYVHSAWKKHQDAVFWVDIDFAIKEGLTFYQTRSNAIILQGTLPPYCIPKVVRLKTGEVLYEKSYISARPPPKISLQHDHDWTKGNDELGSIVEQQHSR